MASPSQVFESLFAFWGCELLEMCSVVPLGAWQWPRLSGHLAVPTAQLWSRQARAGATGAPLPLQPCSLALPICCEQPGAGRTGGAGLGRCVPGLVCELLVLSAVVGQGLPSSQERDISEGRHPQTGPGDVRGVLLPSYPEMVEIARGLLGSIWTVRAAG